MSKGRIHPLTAVTVCCFGLVASVGSALDLRTQTLRAERDAKMTREWTEMQTAMECARPRHGWNRALCKRWHQKSPAPLMPRPDFQTGNADRYQFDMG